MHQLIGKAGTILDIEKLLSQTVLSSWKSVNQRVSDLLAQLSEEQIHDEIAPGRNRAFYIVGHLTAVSGRMVPLLGVGERRFPNLDTVYLERPDRTEADPPAPADLKAAWQDLTTRLTDFQELRTVWLKSFSISKIVPAFLIN